jgi:hypothetical protein
LGIKSNILQLLYKSIFKEKRAYLSDAGAPCANILFQHFCSALLSLDVAFVELVLINANANAKPVFLFLTLHIGKIILRRISS